MVPEPAEGKKKAQPNQFFFPSTGSGPPIELISISQLKSCFYILLSSPQLLHTLLIVL